MAELTLENGPVTQDFTLYQGDRFELYFKVYSLIWNAATGKYDKGPYVDLTGQTPKAQIKAQRGAAEAVVASFACSLADQVADKGGVLCVLLPAQAELLTANSYVYDVQLSSDADHITTYITGQITVTKQVTSGV